MKEQEGPAVSDPDDQADDAEVWRPGWLPSSLAHIALVGVAWWWLVTSSFPGFNLDQLFPAVALLVLLAFWTFGVLRHLAGTRRATRKWWWIFPAIVALVLFVSFAGLHYRVRWELSQGDFEEFVEQHAASPDGTLAERETLGHFDTELIVKRAGEIVFYTFVPNGFYQGGIVYAPNGPIGDVDNYGDASDLRHIEGPWYMD